MKIENSDDLIKFLKENVRLVSDITSDNDCYDLKILLKCIDPESRKDIIISESWIDLSELSYLFHN